MNLTASKSFSASNKFNYNNLELYLPYWKGQRTFVEKNWQIEYNNLFYSLLLYSSGSQMGCLDTFLCRKLLKVCRQLIPSTTLEVFLMNNKHIFNCFSHLTHQVFLSLTWLWIFKCVAKFFFTKSVSPSRKGWETLLYSKVSEYEYRHDMEIAIKA